MLGPVRAVEKRNCPEKIRRTSNVTSMLTLSCDESQSRRLSFHSPVERLQRERGGVFDRFVFGIPMRALSAGETFIDELSFIMPVCLLACMDVLSVTFTFGFIFFDFMCVESMCDCVCPIAVVSCVCAVPCASAMYGVTATAVIAMILRSMKPLIGGIGTRAFAIRAAVTDLGGMQTLIPTV
ncbi:MAG: hypothetical protein ABI446_04895 [Gemmatimonadaceae bacterium]